jgi:Zn-dependent M16 (insulinase) family peptidase
MVAWRGRGFTDYSHTVALNILHAYLSESEVSVLHRHFVEGEGDEEVCQKESHSSV